MLNQSNKMGSCQDGYDHLLKILVIGDSTVGKSSVMNTFVGEHFNSKSITTVGVDFKIRSLDFNGKRVKLHIWDTAGQDRFRVLTSTYYRGSHGVIVVFDVTNGNSFANVKK